LKEFPAALLVSAKDPAAARRVRDAIIRAPEANMTEVELVVPYDAGSAIGEIHKVHVISESYEGDGVHYRMRAPEAAIERIPGDAALKGAVEARRTVLGRTIA
jgi:hypothetical protein